MSWGRAYCIRDGTSLGPGRKRPVIPLGRQPNKPHLGGIAALSAPPPGRTTVQY